MIVRQSDQFLYLITQADHAALAARIMSFWQAGEWPSHPMRSRILHATEQHDCGWREFDAAAAVNPETGMPYDVIGAPLAMRQGAWHRALDQLTPEDPYVAALVAHHAITVYARYTPRPEWRHFFCAMEQQRDALLAGENIGLPTLLEDYAILALGDRWSLMFCYGWLEPNHMHGFQGRLLDGGRLVVTPGPFRDAVVKLEVAARRIPRRFYASDCDLQQELERAPLVVIEGEASGVTHE